MNTDKRTMGEWVADYSRYEHTYLIKVGDKTVAQVTDKGHEFEETEANAAYICKAVNNH